MSLRICIICERLAPPFDEGVKKLAYNLMKEFSKNNSVLGLTRQYSKNQLDEDCFIKPVPINRLFLNAKLRKEIKNFKPHIIYYIPKTACATIFSFFRAKVLRLYANNTRTVMITLQPRKYNCFSKRIIPLILPDVIFAQSIRTKQTLSDLGANVSIIPSGVDLQRFAPADHQLKRKLRKKYCFPTNKYLVLHIGHINPNRNVQFLPNIQLIHGAQAVVVGSTSTPQDEWLAKELEMKGIILITKYIEKIEEIYQCADCYLFPVLSETGSIEIPLSILEAMASNLPVVTTKFSGLPDHFPEQDGFFYAETEEEIFSKINTARSIGSPRTRNIAEQYSWESIAKRLLNES